MTRAPRTSHRSSSRRFRGSGGSAANPGFAGLEAQAAQLAQQLNVALVDLTALSRAYYTTVPDKNALFVDGTHFHEVGAIGVAGVVAQALKTSSLPLKTFVKSSPGAWR